jgi:hypothetical protein
MDEIGSAPPGDRTFWQLLERSKGSVDTSRWDAVKDNEGNLLTPDSPMFLTRWEEYYQKLGSPKSTASQSPKWKEVNEKVESERFFSDPVSPSDSVAAMNADLTLEEVKVALEGLPNHKAVGADGYSNEVLKALGPEALHGVLSRLWDKGISADTFNLAVIHPLHKPGDPTDLGNSRGISLLSCVSKLYESLLKTRLEAFLEGSNAIAPEQGGFRAGRECAEHVIILTESLRRRKQKGKKTYLGFIDFAKAFDVVWRNGLMLKLRECGVEGRMLRAISALYAETTAAVRVNGSCTRAFPMSLGVRQGGVLSPLLFLVFINDFMKELKSRKLGVFVPGVKRASPFVERERLAGLLWADDLVLVTESPEKLREAFALLDTWCQKWLMSVNPSKCNVMVVGSDPSQAFVDLTKVTDKTPFMLGGEVVRLARSYKYLGLVVTDDLEWTAAIKARTEIVRKVIFTQSKILNNRDLSPELRYRFFDAVVMSSALYGSELWAENINGCKTLEATLASGLRMIIGTPPRASRFAIGLELGYVPVHLRAAVRRLRIMEKWKAIKPLTETSGKWASLLVNAKKPKGKKAWSWFRRSAFMASKWLRVGLTTSELIDPKVKTFPIDSKQLLAKPTHAWFRSTMPQNANKVNETLLAIHGTEVCPTMAPYLRMRGPRGRVFAMIRTGSLLLNDKVGKWSLTRSRDCPSCSGSERETLEHFVLKCPRYNRIREEWFQEWNAQTGAETLREPISLLAALGESARFFADKLSPQQASAMQVARMNALQGMWSQRCAILAQRLAVIPPPRVDSQ